MPNRPAENPDPVQPADAAARALALSLLATNHAALSYHDDTGAPAISRIAFGLCPDAQPMTLISRLAPHFAGLKADPRCAIMLGDPGPKGDPLTHPRLMIRARAQFCCRG